MSDGRGVCKRWEDRTTPPSPDPPRPAASHDQRLSFPPPQDLAKGKQALGITRQEERDAAEAASDEEEDEEGGGSSLELDEALFSSSGLAKRGEGTGDSGDTSPAPAFPHGEPIAHSRFGRGQLPSCAHAHCSGTHRCGRVRHAG